VFHIPVHIFVVILFGCLIYTCELGKSKWWRSYQS